MTTEGKDKLFKRPLLLAQCAGRQQGCRWSLVHSFLGQDLQSQDR
jgi:hypothetical protein